MPKGEIHQLFYYLIRAENSICLSKTRVNSRVCLIYVNQNFCKNKQIIKTHGQRVRDKIKKSETTLQGKVTWVKLAKCLFF